MLAVRQWLGALAASDASKLSSASISPFTLATDYRRRKCDGIAKDPKALAKLLRCVISNDKILAGELKYMDENPSCRVPSLGGCAVGSRRIRARLRERINRLGSSEGETTVEGYLNGDGVTFELIFALRPDDGGRRASGLLLHYEVVE